MQRAWVSGGCEGPLTEAILQDEASLERHAADESDHLGRAVVKMDAIEAARVEVANGHRNASAHQDGVVGDIGKVALATQPIGSIGVRTLGCKIELEVVVGLAVALDQGQSLGGGVSQLDLLELGGVVCRIRPRIRSGVRWVD